MTLHKARYSREEFARRGQEIYEQKIRPTLRADDENKFVAIDIESADYEIDREDHTATERLLGRRPAAQMWLVRVGQPAAYRLGRLPASPRTQGQESVPDWSALGSATIDKQISGSTTELHG